MSHTKKTEGVHLLSACIMGCGASKSAAGESVSGKSAVGQDVGDRLVVLEKKLVAEQVQREALEDRLAAEVLQRTALEERLAAVDAQRIRGDDVLAEESLPGNLDSSTAAVLAAVEQTLKDQLAEAEARSSNFAGDVDDVGAEFGGRRRTKGVLGE